MYFQEQQKNEVEVYAHLEFNPQPHEINNIVVVRFNEAEQSIVEAVLILVWA